MSIVQKKRLFNTLHYWKHWLQIVLCELPERNKRKAKKAKKNEIQEEDQSSEIMDEENPIGD